jgi:hypothetical protein
MTLSPTALAPAAICRDFEADVLARLARHGATMHGCPVEAVECRLDGAVVAWFAGRRDGIAWRGALRFGFPWLHQRRLLADAGAVTEVALQLLDAIARQCHL